MKIQCMTTLTVILITIAAPLSASANAKGVGIGVAGGLAWSADELEHTDGTRSDVGSGSAWGFFVDIPLTDTFYLSPATTIYELNLGDEKKPVTDIDLNFKFMIPLNKMKLALGVTAGVTIAEEKYHGHWGVLGYFSYNLLSNIDIFVMTQYKQLVRTGKEINNLHNYLGFMFRF